MSTLGLSLCQWGLPPDRAQEPGDAPEGLQLPLPWAEARGDRGWGGLHQEGMEDTPELAKNLRPSRLPPEQGGPEGCQRQPVWHVHHPLGQGETVRVRLKLCYFVIITQLLVLGLRGETCLPMINDPEVDHLTFWLYQVPSSSEDTSMADKEAILATLNIKAMTFDDTFSALPKSNRLRNVGAPWGFELFLRSSPQWCDQSSGQGDRVAEARNLLRCVHPHHHRAREWLKRPVHWPRRRRWRPRHWAVSHSALRLWHSLCCQCPGLPHGYSINR